MSIYLFVFRKKLNYYKAMVFKINDKLVRKGISKEVYYIKAEKHVNNILHFIIKSKNTGDIILSKHAIEKDFLTEEEYSKKKHTKNFASAFSEKIKKLLSN